MHFLVQKWENMYSFDDILLYKWENRPIFIENNIIMYGWAFYSQCLSAFKTLVSKNKQASINQVRDYLLENGLKQDKKLIYRRVWAIFTNLHEEGLLMRTKLDSKHMSPYYYKPSPKTKITFIDVTEQKQQGKT